MEVMSVAAQSAGIVPKLFRALYKQGLGLNGVEERILKFVKTGLGP